MISKLFWLIIYRMIGGLAVGAALIIAPTYIAEVAPPEKRGQLVSFNQLNIVIGISIAFFTNYVILKLGDSDAEWAKTSGFGKWNWRWWMLGLETFPAILYYLGLLIVPRSPRWLMTQNRKEEALEVMKKVVSDEIWPPGSSWGHHWTDFDALRTLNFEVLADQSRDGFEKFVTATQIAQGVIFQYALEHFRTRKPKTSAICICHYITFAPDMKWGIVDYYQEKKLSFDYVRKAYQPVLITMKHYDRRWLPGEDFKGELWIVNDLYKSFNNCKANVKFLDNTKAVIKEEVFDISEIQGDSSAKFVEVLCKVSGIIGDKFYVEITLVDADGNIISENDYMLLVADKEKDRKELRAIGLEAFEIKEKYGWANYFRYYPSLGGEDGVPEADQKMPIARGFEQ